MNLHIRARMVNAYRHAFPHPAVTAKRERARIASKASDARSRSARAAVLAKAAEIRGEARS